MMRRVVMIGCRDLVAGGAMLRLGEVTGRDRHAQPGRMPSGLAVRRRTPRLNALVPALADWAAHLFIGAPFGCWVFGARALGAAARRLRSGGCRDVARQVDGPWCAVLGSRII